jgi:chaperonin GroES
VATSKKKPVAKKATKAAKKPAKKPAVKTVKAVKKPAKTASGKKAVKKAVLKKSVVKKAAKKPAPQKKAAPKKATATKPVAKKPSSPAKFTLPALAPAKLFKKLDLSGFVTPLDDRVLIQVAEAAKMTAGGLYIPDTVADVSGNSLGYVVSVGRGRRDKKGRVHPMDLTIGDKVLFSEYSGSKIKIQEQDLLIVRESDVLGVIG